ncbi:MAG: endonuclease III [Defluviitaleaceae bacterium]|nr:endonuclease III [Defluviitaleaceae bacterium]
MPRKLLQILDALYPWDGTCFLEYETPWQLLFATILSAQCTDERVNQVTRTLFARLPALEDYIHCDYEALAALVRPTGFFRVKARNLQQTAHILVHEYGGVLPSDIDALTALPGVGRKTANVVRGHIFHLPSVTVDTHVGRVARRLGLTLQTDAVKIEFDLMKKLPRKYWIRINQQLISHGRAVCKSQRPRCGECALISLCPYGKTALGNTTKNSPKKESRP